MLPLIYLIQKLFVPVVHTENCSDIIYAKQGNHLQRPYEFILLGGLFVYYAEPKLRQNRVVTVLQLLFKP